MSVSPTTVNKTLLNTLPKETLDPTTKKTSVFSKEFFKKALFWSAVVVGGVFAFSIIKSALTNPVSAIALGVLGIWAFNNKDKIMSSLKVYFHALKEKLGLSQSVVCKKVTNNISIGDVPMHGKNSLEVLQKEEIKAVVSVMHHGLKTYTTAFSKPISGYEFTRHNIQHIDITTQKPGELMIEEMDMIADILHEKTQENKKVLIHGEHDSVADQMGLMAYLIKYEKTSLKDAQQRLKEIRPDVVLSDACLGRLYQFFLQVNPE